MESNIKPYAETVKDRREALGWSQERLAGRAEISAGTVRNIELRRTTPRGKTRRRIERAFQMAEFDRRD